MTLHICRLPPLLPPSQCRCMHHRDTLPAASTWQAEVLQDTAAAAVEVMVVMVMMACCHVRIMQLLLLLLMGTLVAGIMLLEVVVERQRALPSRPCVQLPQQWQSVPPACPCRLLPMHGRWQPHPHRGPPSAGAATAAAGRPSGQVGLGQREQVQQVQGLVQLGVSRERHRGCLGC